jgi:ligand-binding SRPBCC domain-containing protein
MIQFKDHSGIHTLRLQQTLPVKGAEAWEFLSNPKNLSKITPNHMKFNITSSIEKEKIFPGQIITYKISPFKGITINWVTEITHVKEGSYFVDEQRFGPYKFWHHLHSLKEITDGVQMEDQVSYKLPLGFIGRLINRFIVEKNLKKIFQYRFDKLEEIFDAPRDL